MVIVQEQQLWVGTGGAVGPTNPPSKYVTSVSPNPAMPLNGVRLLCYLFAGRISKSMSAFVQGFGCRPDVIDGPVQRPASESLRRTDPREAASGLPSMGILWGSGFGEA
jgi:hypothetical protein